MIELKRNVLSFSFPEVHPRAKLQIEFERTLRIPDDDNDYSLPPGLGSFPLRHVDDYAEKVPGLWLQHGGVMMPMYQSEALWISFLGSEYPFALKIAAGKINAVTGEQWGDTLTEDPQDYVVVPDQPWLDGFCIEKGVIRQFVAMPLGSGYTAEEQLTQQAEHGGLQIVAYPMKRKAYEKLSIHENLTSISDFLSYRGPPTPDNSMALAPGGRMKQEIYEDEHGIDKWDIDHKSRCFVHMSNSLVWRSITGENPPTVPPTSKEYTDADLPWFEYYGGDTEVLEGSKKLKKLKSVVEIAIEKKDVPIPENETVTPKNINIIRTNLKKGQVREYRNTHSQCF